MLIPKSSPLRDKLIEAFTGFLKQNGYKNVHAFSVEKGINRFKIRQQLKVVANADIEKINKYVRMIDATKQIVVINNQIQIR